MKIILASIIIFILLLGASCQQQSTRNKTAWFAVYKDPECKTELKSGDWDYGKKEQTVYVKNLTKDPIVLQWKFDENPTLGNISGHFNAVKVIGDFNPSSLKPGETYIRPNDVAPFVISFEPQNKVY